MGGRQRDEDEPELIASINITPLVDIILVLLLLTMVTATVFSAEAIPLELPTAGPSARDDVRPMIVSLSADGSVRIDGVPVPEGELRETLRRYRQLHGPNVRAVFEADGFTSHRDVIRAIDAVRAAGLERLQLRMPAERRVPQPETRSGATTTRPSRPAAPRSARGASREGPRLRAPRGRP